MIKMETVSFLCGNGGGGRRRGSIASQSGMGQLAQRTVFLSLLLFVQTVISLTSRSPHTNAVPDNVVDYGGMGKQFKYIWGDAMADPKAIGPDGNPYPWDLATKIASKQRNPRTLFAEEFGGADTGLINPETTRQILLKSFEAQEFGGGMNSFFGSLSHSHHHHHAHGHSNNEDDGSGGSSRKGRHFNREGHAYSINRNRSNKRSSYRSEDAPSPPSAPAPPGSSTMSPPPPNPDPMQPGEGGNNGGGHSDGGCVPSRLCPSTYNTTAPLYGISLTSGQPVTIVQKFPDLLQQVVFQVCKTSECDVIHGECVQTYLPYLFLVIPLGPVTLTGQDYVLVESGCVCRPKYASKKDEAPTLPFIQAYSNSTRERKRTQG